MTSQLAHQQILRHVYLLILILGSAAATLLGFAYLGYAAELPAQRHLAEFHLRSLTLTREVTAQVARLQLRGGRLASATAGERAPSAPVTRERETRIILFSIGQALDSIHSLQVEHGEGLFRGTVERAQLRYDRVSTLQAGRAVDADRFADALASLELSIHQLDRMHSLAAQEELESIAQGDVRRTILLVLSTVLVVVLTGAVVAKLAGLVTARLRQLRDTEAALLQSERQLLQSQKMEALGTLVGGVAHDFNNLLTAILGNADLLRLELGELGPGRSRVDEIRMAGKRAAGLTRQLLAFSRQEMVEPEVVDVGNLLHDMEPLLRRLLPGELLLHVEVEARQGRVLADAVQLQQVILNLVVNSRDAMPQGGWLSVSCSDHEARPAAREPGGPPVGSWVRVRVEDTGCGISEELRLRIFEPFFTTKERGKGTGLGLSMVHGIVTRAGGHVRVGDGARGGARFDVFLPRCEASVEEPRAEQPLPSERGEATILVVEDEAPIRELVRRALQGEGYRVLEADCGRSALELVGQQRGAVDLIVTDVLLPGLRGPELVEQALPLCPGARVVFVSGYSQDAVLDSVRSSGHPLLHKPFPMRRLLEVVRSELGAPAEAGSQHALSA